MIAVLFGVRRPWRRFGSDETLPSQSVATAPRDLREITSRGVRPRLEAPIRLPGVDFTYLGVDFTYLGMISHTQV